MDIHSRGHPYGYSCMVICLSIHGGWEMDINWLYRQDIHVDLRMYAYSCMVCLSIHGEWDMDIHRTPISKIHAWFGFAYPFLEDGSRVSVGRMDMHMDIHKSHDVHTWIFMGDIRLGKAPYKPSYSRGWRSEGRKAFVSHLNLFVLTSEIRTKR